MGKWCVERPEDYAAVQSLLRQSYPSLHAYRERERIYIRGAFPIIIDGNEVDRFQIEIEMPDNYPHDFPIVRETIGRLPKILNRHFNGDDTACLFLKDESYKHYTPQSTIVDFLDVCVKSFFVWQIEYDLTGGKPTRNARGHGLDGTIEFYKEELGVDSVAAIVQFLEYHTSKKVKGHWPCFCGSHKELRRCHLDKVNDLRKKIRRSYALNSLSDLKRSGRAQKSY
jgi:hypothetical protein